MFQDLNQGHQVKILLFLQIFVYFLSYFIFFIGYKIGCESKDHIYAIQSDFKFIKNHSNETEQAFFYSMKNSAFPGLINFHQCTF